MAFRSSAYAVVARIFKLIDSTGFVRLLFGPKTFGPPINIDGYAFEYDEPGWSGEQTGLIFGDSTGVPVRSALYGVDDTSVFSTVCRVNVDDNGFGTVGARSDMNAKQDAVGGGEAIVSAGVSDGGGIDKLATAFLSAGLSGLLTTATVVIQADEATGETYVDLTGMNVRVTIDGNSAYDIGITDWQNITLLSANWTINAQPQWRREGNRIWLRGQITKTVATFPPPSNLFTFGGGNPDGPQATQVCLGPATIVASVPDSQVLTWAADAGTGNFRSGTATFTVAIGDSVRLDGINYFLN